MPKVNLIVTVDSQVLGGQQSATLNRATNMLDTTVQGDAFEAKTPGLKNWSVDCDGFVVENDAGFKALEQAWLNNTQVAVEMNSDDAGGSYTGNAFISSFPLESSYSDTAKMNITFEGSGALTITPKI